MKAPKNEAADIVAARVRFDYPHLAVSSVRATVAASEVKGEYDLLRDPDEQLRERADGIQPPSRKGTGPSPSTARRQGMVTHLVLQHMDLAAAGDRRALDVELNHLVDRAVLDEKEVELVDRPAIEWFFNTPLGEAIRRAGQAYRREFMFLGTQPAARFDPTLDPSEEEPVLVRGIVDGILELDDGLEVIDFKTDRVGADEVPQRAENYRQQMSLYAACITPLFAKPVKQCRLIFLHPRVIVPVISETSPHANDPTI